MQRARQVELVLLVAAALATLAAAPWLPERIGAGELVLFGACALLAQGLARDLWLLARLRRAAREPARAARCVCAESTLGSLGVLAGLALSVAGASPWIAVPAWTLALGVLGVGVLGAALADVVVAFGPLRIRRERDHQNVVVAWRRAHTRGSAGARHGAR